MRSHIRSTRRLPLACSAALTIAASSIAHIPAPAAALSTFYDIQGHWSQLCVEQLAQQGIVRGNVDGSYRPEASITRAQFAAMVRQAFIITPQDSTELPFFDVPSDSQYFRAIQEAQERGFVSGYPGGTFRPEESMSRVDALVALVSGLDYTSGNVSLSDLSEIFSDARSIPDYALSAIAAAVSNRIVVSYPNARRLDPNRPTTRAEVAAFFCQALSQPDGAGAGVTSPVPIQFVTDTPSAPAPVVETRTSRTGFVRSELSYDKQNFIASNLNLTILRGDETVVEGKLPIEGGVNRTVGFQLRDLDGDNEPEIIVDFFSRAEGCCSTSLLFRYVPAQNRYAAVQQTWGYAWYQLKDLNLDGVPEFTTFDDRFALRFVSDIEDSAMPIRILQYSQGQLFDVTRQFPNVVRDRARALWEEYQRRERLGQEIRGVLAAYVAEKHLLGEGDDGFRRVQAAYDRPDRSIFLNELREFLRGAGYLR